MGSLVLISVFLLIIACLARSRGELLAFFALFATSTAVKLGFLVAWASHQGWGSDLERLQFVDEWYYVNYNWGDPAATFGNGYCFAVRFLQDLGFTFFDLKLLNIFAAGLALVRLYSLNDLVHDRRRYFWLLLVLGAVLHLHVTYYSIFVLKEGLVFLFTMELLVQCIRRRTSNTSVSMLAAILALGQLRSAFLYVFGVFLFDRDWNISWRRAILLVAVLGVFSIGAVQHVQERILARYAGGLQYVAGESDGQRVSADDARAVLSSNTGLLVALAVDGLKTAFSPLDQQNVTDVLILLELYAALAYLLATRPRGLSPVTVLPLLFFPASYFAISTLSYVTLRWAIYPYATLYYLLVFLACRPLEGVLPCPKVVFRFLPQTASARLGHEHG